MLSTPNANPGNRSNAITARSVQGEVRSFLILRSPSASRPYARSPVVTRKLCGSLTAARPRGKGGDTPATPRHPRRARSARAGIGRARARPRVEPSPNDGCLRARYPRRSPPGSFPGRHGLRFSLVARKVEAQSPRPELGADGGEDLSRIVARAVVDEEDARPGWERRGRNPSARSRRRSLKQGTTITNSTISSSAMTMRLAEKSPAWTSGRADRSQGLSGVQKGASAAGLVVLSACECSSPAARSGRGADQGGPRPAHSGLAGFRPRGGRVREAGLGSGNTLQLPGTAARRRSLGARDQAADPAGRWRRNGAGGGGVARRTLRPPPRRGARSSPRPRIQRDGSRPDPKRAMEHGPDPRLVRDPLAPVRSAGRSAPGARRRARRDPPADFGVQPAGGFARRRGGDRRAGNASGSGGLPRSEKAPAARTRRRALRPLRRRIHGLARSSFVDADRAPGRHPPWSERSACAD